VESAKTLIEQGNIAAEGIQGAGGYIVGTKKFLVQIQESAKEASLSILGFVLAILT
jgi:glutamate-1-semialdehyde 2,1-aminomutase